VFAHLADATRPVLDFETMGVALLTASGRDLEMLAEIDDVAGGPETPPRIPLEDFSFATHQIHGAHGTRRDTARDRLIIEVAGTLPHHPDDSESSRRRLCFGKRHWFDRLDAGGRRGLGAGGAGRPASATRRGAATPGPSRFTPKLSSG
jgi:hypothetical protein